MYTSEDLKVIIMIILFMFIVRYSDFLVNEISSEGDVVTLTSTELPCPLPDTVVQVGDNSPGISDSCVALQTAAWHFRQLCDISDSCVAF